MALISTDRGRLFWVAGLVSLPARLLRRILSKGPVDTARRIGFLAYEAYREWRLGIATGGFIHWYELGDDPQSVDYDPIGYGTLDLALQQVALRPGEDVFLDYGCGKGRPLVSAATLGFARVIGVELSEQLCELARENVRRAAGRLRCHDVEVVQAAAQDYWVPEDVTVIFMFNPFTGNVLDRVVERIRQSLERRPRKLIILYVIPFGARDGFSDCRWLRRRYERLTQGLRLGVYESR